MAQNSRGIGNKTFGRPLAEPVLGANYSLPAHALLKAEPVQDYSMRIIPVYRHLKMYHVESIEIPTFQQCLNDVKNTLRNSKWNGSVFFLQTWLILVLFENLIPSLDVGAVGMSSRVFIEEINIFSPFSQNSTWMSISSGYRNNVLENWKKITFRQK